MQKVKIGIPRAFLYYKYQVMWRCFFEELGCEVKISPNTNKAILEAGTNCSIDESCTSAKVYMGHVSWLVGRCDYIFVPRVVSYEDGDVTCTKFHALYDIVKSVFPDANILHYNIDYDKRQTQWKAYRKLGRELGAKPVAVRKAYEKAMRVLEDYEANLERKQERLLGSDKTKVLVVAHPYNIYDKLIGEPIVKCLKELGVDVLYADIPDSAMMCRRSKAISYSMYWRYNKEIVGAIEHYREYIDGIIFFTTFPCGPDSLVVELTMRKIKGIPMTNITADANSGEAGLQTRIESFVDIIEAKRGAGTVCANEV